MPRPEEYAEAITWMDKRDRQSPLKHYSLALRWLRVGAAMEHDGLLLDAPRNGGDLFRATMIAGEAHFSPDPLTAAERAMGVGT